MIARGVGRAIAGLALVAAVVACDDNPLAENREDGAYFQVNVSDGVVEVHDTIRVVANVMNKYGAGLVVDISATPCDAAVSVAKDPVRSPYEYPEQFKVWGNSVGESCIIVKGAGVTDTIQVRVVPAAISLSGPGGTVLSGAPFNLTISYLSATGAAAPGIVFGPATTITVTPASAAAVDGTTVTPRAPGAATIVAKYEDLGVTRIDSISIVVEAGAFDGSGTQSASTAGGQILTINPGATAFDANTSIQMIGTPGGTYPRIAGMPGLVVNLPPGLAVGDTVSYNIVNVGPDEFAYRYDHVVTAPTAALNNQTVAGAIPLAVGEEVFGIIEGSRGVEAWFEVTIATAGDYNFSFGWSDNLDKDLYLLDAGQNVLVALENAAATNPEQATRTLDPGTYYLVGSVWTPNPGDASFYRMKIVQVP